MKIVTLMFFLIFNSCNNENYQSKEKVQMNSGETFNIKENAISNTDSCNVYVAFDLFRKNVINRNKDQIAKYFDFPITDNGLITYVNSQFETSYSIDSISELSIFKNLYKKLFPDKFLYFFEQAENSNLIKGELNEIGWKSTYSSNGRLSERNKLQYRIDDNLIIIMFITESYDDNDIKYELTVEYQFSYIDCKIKFERIIIAG